MSGGIATGQAGLLGRLADEAFVPNADACAALALGFRTIVAARAARERLADALPNPLGPP